MKLRLQQARLLKDEEIAPEINISLAWSILSRLGYPSRYSGRAQDGSYEYVIISPQTGDFLASGKGMTLETSMCEAALNARATIDTNGGLKPGSDDNFQPTSDEIDPTSKKKRRTQ